MGQVEIPHGWIGTRCYDSRNAQNTKLLYKTQRKVGHSVQLLSSGKLPLHVSTEYIRNRYKYSQFAFAVEIYDCLIESC